MTPNGATALPGVPGSAPWISLPISYHGPAFAPRDAMNTTRSISRDELQARMANAAPFTLFEVLPRPYWRKHHLPGALSLPPDQVATLVPELVPDKDAEIVLYCWDFT